MQHLIQDDLARRAVRSQICPVCSQRPAGSETLSPTQSRECETTCAIFHGLPTLQTMVASRDPRLDSVEQALRNTVCNHCTLSPSAGDYCSESLARTCPLSRYALHVVAVLQRLPLARPTIPRLGEATTDRCDSARAMEMANRE